VIIWIIIAILAIVTFVAAYFSSRTWHWGNVTLTVLIFLMGVLAILLTAKVVQIRAYYGKQISQRTAQLERLEDDVRALKVGTRESEIISRLAADEIRFPEGAEEIGGLGDLSHQLQLRSRLRGRVWRNTGPAGPADPETGAIPVAVEQPKPHGIEANTILYVFEQGPASQPNGAQGAQFLGEFQVTDAGEAGVQLRPVHKFDSDEETRLANSRGPWTLYETMPVDQHELFAHQELDAQQREQLLRSTLPEESVQEYIRHGGPVTPDDDEWHRAAYDETGKRLGPEEDAQGAREVYDRPLRDYDYLFQELAGQRAMLLAEIAATEMDNQRLEATLASAQKLQDYRQAEIEKLTSDLQGVKKDRQAIESHLAQVQRQVANAQELLAQTLRHNRELALQLTHQQVGAAIP
jgi:hypothetical protein